MRARNAAALLGFLAFVTARLAAADPTFDRFVDTLAAEWVRADPMAATTSQYFSGPEQDALDRQLTSIAPAARAARLALAQRGLADLARFERGRLSSSQRISAAMLEWQLDDIVRSEEFRDYDFVFQQFRGLQVQLVNFLSQTHPIRHRRDIENYLVRLEQVAPQMDEGIVEAKDRAARGIIPPKFILTATIAQLDRFLQDEPARNVLVASLDARAASITLPVAERKAFVASAEKLTVDSIIPAFRRVKDMLQQQLPSAGDAAGLSRLPGGDKAYANALRRNTTTAMSADEIHALGRREVARIEAQMDRLLLELGFSSGSAQERYAKLNASFQPKEADPRPALLARYTELVRDAEKRAVALFDLRPKAACEVHREPPFTEKSAAAHYTRPSPDGTRPGIFWVPLPGPAFGIIGMRSLTYHEAVPGHHFQIALQAELEELPNFRRNRVFGGLSAHSEGWGLYAERLAAESGWYEGDKAGAIGQLNSELFRARRLVVDTGLHAKQWTRQQAIDFGISATEIERYVVTPGQACAYKIGELRILAVRDKAMRALGEKFSLKEFHNLILRNGNVPLDVLEQVVDDWIRGGR